MKLILLIPLFFFYLHSSAQPGSNFNEAIKHLASEQLFIHTNQQSYVCGETIYFKAYAISGQYPSTYSSSLLIQLLSDSGTIQKKVFPIISGVSTGSFNIPGNLPEGRYFLEAFTNTSIREDRNVIQPVFVSNPASNSNLGPVTYQAQPDLSLHYSQKKLVAGLMNRIFVSITDQYHQPVIMPGELIDGSGQLVQSFTTNAAGAAEVSFVPDHGKHYLVQIDSLGKKISKSLLPSTNEGVEMNINEEAGAYTVTVTTSKHFPEQKLYLFAENQNVVLLTSELTFQNNVAKLKFPMTSLPTGVIRFNLLTAGDSSLAERFVFSNNTEGVTAANFTFEKDNDKNAHFSLQFRDASEGTISAQIMNPATATAAFVPRENILNRLLFSSHLKDPVSFAIGLIQNISTADVPLINSILATNALNKPEWESLKLYTNQPVITKDTNFIMITGIVTPVYKKKLPKNSELNIILKTPDSSQAVFNVPLDAGGKFVLNGVTFTDSASLFYQLNSKKLAEKEIRVSIFSQSLEDLADMPIISSNWNAYFVPLGKEQATVRQKEIVNERYEVFASENAKLLSDVTINSKKKSMQDINAETEKRYVAPLFNSLDARTINFIDRPPSIDAIELAFYLKRFYKPRFMVEETGIFSFNSLTGKREYDYFLDESNVVYERIKDIPLRDIALIKIYQNNFVGAAGNGPTVAIYLRDNSDLKGKPNMPLGKMTIYGYASASDFMLPQEPAAKKEQKYFSNFYWNPYLLIDTDNKKLTVPFIKINKAPNANVIVEGISSDGRLIYANSIINLD